MERRNVYAMLNQANKDGLREGLIAGFFYGVAATVFVSAVIELILWKVL